MCENGLKNLLLWQLTDSGFPSGGFAHSAGLEASVHHGHVEGGDSVLAYARQTLAQAGRGALPIVTAAHRRPDDIVDLDELTDVFLSNPVANRASRAQGRAWLTSVSRSFPQSPLSSVQALAGGGGIAAHHAPLFGVILNALGMSLFDTQRALLFTSVRVVTSAAVRLGSIGSYEAQAIQAALAPEIDAVIETCGGIAPRDIAQTAPLADLFQSTHDRLYSRLFQS